MKFGETFERKLDGSKIKVTIILPTFNEELGMKLLDNTAKELVSNGVKSENIKIIRVAGVMEIPFIAKLESKDDFQCNVIIALGIVIKGSTDHYELVINTSHGGLMQVQLEMGIPIIFGILACRTPEQAIERVKTDSYDKGKEYAHAALMQATIIDKI
jgi:6,7-dimethyl-8-ribityllumazine synthase